MPRAHAPLAVIFRDIEISGSRASSPTSPTSPHVAPGPHQVLVHVSFLTVDKRPRSTAIAQSLQSDATPAEAQRPALHCDECALRQLHLEGVPVTVILRLDAGPTPTGVASARQLRERALVALQDVVRDYCQRGLAKRTASTEATKSPSRQADGEDAHPQPQRRGRVAEADALLHALRLAGIVDPAAAPSPDFRPAAAAPRPAVDASADGGHAAGGEAAEGADLWKALTWSTCCDSDTLERRAVAAASASSVEAERDRLGYSERDAVAATALAREAVLSTLHPNDLVVLGADGRLELPYMAPPPPHGSGAAAAAEMPGHRRDVAAPSSVPLHGAVRWLAARNDSVNRCAKGVDRAIANFAEHLALTANPESAGLFAPPEAARAAIGAAGCEFLRNRAATLVCALDAAVPMFAHFHASGQLAAAMPLPLRVGLLVDGETFEAQLLLPVLQGLVDAYTASERRRAEERRAVGIAQALEASRRRRARRTATSAATTASVAPTATPGGRVTALDTIFSELGLTVYDVALYGPSQRHRQAAAAECAELSRVRLEEEAARRRPAAVAQLEADERRRFEIDVERCQAAVERELDNRRGAEAGAAAATRRAGAMSAAEVGTARALCRLDLVRQAQKRLVDRIAARRKVRDSLVAVSAAEAAAAQRAADDALALADARAAVRAQLRSQPHAARPELNPTFTPASQISAAHVDQSAEVFTADDTQIFERARLTAPPKAAAHDTHGALSVSAAAPDSSHTRAMQPTAMPAPFVSVIGCSRSPLSHAVLNRDRGPAADALPRPTMQSSLLGRNVAGMSPPPTRSAAKESPPLPAATAAARALLLRLAADAAAAAGPATPSVPIVPAGSALAGLVSSLDSAVAASGCEAVDAERKERDARAAAGRRSGERNAVQGQLQRLHAEKARARLLRHHEAELIAALREVDADYNSARASPSRSGQGMRLD